MQLGFAPLVLAIFLFARNVASTPRPDDQTTGVESADDPDWTIGVTFRY